MIRVAIVATLESIPWMPIVGGLLEGFRLLEEVEAAQAFNIAGRPSLHVEELRAFAPDLVLFPCHRTAWRKAAPYVAAAKELGARTAAINFDDPYDMETGLAMAKELGFVFTPELLAVDVYERLGIPARHLRPTVSTRFHYPPPADHPGLASDYELDVLHVGGNRWTPRKGWLPKIQRWCEQRGRRYGGVAGNNRWIVAHELTAAIHASRTNLEIPRFDLPTQSNPHQVPCTYTGPRVYILAACAALPIVIGPRPDLFETFPDVPHAQDLGDAIELLEFWTAPDMDSRRRALGSRLWAEFHLCHNPETRAGQIIRQLELGNGVPGCGAPLRPGADRLGPRGDTSRPGAATEGEPGTRRPA